MQNISSKVNSNNLIPNPSSNPPLQPIESAVSDLALSNLPALNEEKLVQVRRLTHHFTPEDGKYTYQEVPLLPLEVYSLIFSFNNPSIGNVMATELRDINSRAPFSGALLASSLKDGKFNKALGLAQNKHLNFNENDIQFIWEYLRESINENPSVQNSVPKLNSELKKHLDKIIQENVSLLNSEQKFLAAAYFGLLNFLPDLSTLENNTKNSLLKFALKGNQQQVVELLITMGANPACDRNAPLLIAAEYGDRNLIDFFLKQHEFTAKDIQSAFSKACGTSNLAVFNYFITERKIDPVASENQAIVSACFHGKITIVKLLLKVPEVDPTVLNNFAFLTIFNRPTINTDRIECVKVLLEDGRVDPSLENNKALCTACYLGHYEIVKILLMDKRVNPSDDNNLAILSACARGNIEVVKLLLENSKVNPADNDHAAVHMASYFGYTEIVDLLMQDERVTIPKEKLVANHREGFVDRLSNNIDYAMEDQQPKIVECFLMMDRLTLGEKNWSVNRWASNNNHKEVLDYLNKINYLRMNF